MKRSQQDHSRLPDGKDLLMNKFAQSCDRFLKGSSTPPAEIDSLLKDIDTQMTKKLDYRRKDELSNMRFLVTSQQKLNEEKLKSQKFLKKYGGLYKGKEELDFKEFKREIKITASGVQQKKHHCLNSQDIVKLKELSMQKNEKDDREEHIYEQSVLGQKLSILEGVVTEGERKQLERRIVCGIRTMEKGKDVSRRMKRYFISHYVLQKIFELMFQNTNNLEIKRGNLEMYMRIKEDMVGILSNEESFMAHFKASKDEEPWFPPLTSGNKKQSLKKSYYARDRSQQDLLEQITDTFQAAQKLLKQAFLKQNHPYQAEQLDNKLSGRRRVEGLVI